MKRSELAFTVALVPIDFLLVCAAAATAYSLRFGWLAALRPVTFEIPIGKYLLYTLGSATLFIFLFALSGLYGIAGPRKLRSEISRVFLATSTGIMAVIAGIFFRRELFESRFIVLAAWFLAFLFVSCGRIFIRFLQRLLLQYGIGTHRIVIVSNDTRAADTLSEAFAENLAHGYEVTARFAALDDAARSEIERLVAEGRADEIIVTGSHDSDEMSRLLGFAQSRQIGFKYTADLLATRVRNSEIGDIAGVPIVEIKGTRLDGWGRVFKRAFDVIVSSLLIVLTSPVMLVTAIAIKLDSKGPIFFSKLDDGTPVTRVGEHGRPFRYVKFRSMRPGTHAMRYGELAELDTRRDGPLVKIKDDPRVTRVGKLIRRYSIDELPELFLVFAGYMSLVGPRPHLPEEVAKYEDHHRRVLTIKPGITGLAQVSGRADLTFEEEVRLDTYYIESWSPWLDTAILLKTPLVVIAKKGAY